MATTMTRKGQVTVPKEVRDTLGLKPGSRIVFGRGADGNFVIQKEGETKPPPNRFAKLRGVAGPGLSTDELMALLRGEPE